jgi:hypothetical protein
MRRKYQPHSLAAFAEEAHEEATQQLRHGPVRVFGRHQWPGLKFGRGKRKSSEH